MPEQPRLRPVVVISPSLPTDADRQGLFTQQIVAGLTRHNGPVRVVDLASEDLGDQLTGAEVALAVGPRAAATVAPLVADGTRFVIADASDDEYPPSFDAAVARADVVLASSDADANAVAIAVGGHRDKIIAVPHPVDVDQLPRRDQNRGPYRWLGVSAFGDEAVLRQLVSAFADQVTNAGDPGTVEPVLTIVGDGPLREQVPVWAEELGVSDRIRLVGDATPDEFHTLLGDHDVLLLVEQPVPVPVLVAGVATGLAVVLTPSDAAGETLVIPGVAQRAVQVASQPSATVLREAINRVSPITEADLTDLRATLADVHGPDRFGDLLARHVLNLPVPATGRRRPLRLSVVVQTPEHWKRTQFDVRRALAFGADVTVIDQSGRLKYGPSGARFVSADEPQPLGTVVRTQGLMLEGVPGRALALIRRIARRVPGVGTQLARIVERVQRTHKRYSTKVHNGLNNRLWQVLRGALSARALGASLSAEPNPPDFLAVTAGRETQLAYQLLQTNPQLPYHVGRFGVKELTQWWTTHVPADASKEDVR